MKNKHNCLVVVSLFSVCFSHAMLRPPVNEGMKPSGASDSHISIPVSTSSRSSTPTHMEARGGLTEVDISPIRKTKLTKQGSSPRRQTVHQVTELLMVADTVPQPRHKKRENIDPQAVLGEFDRLKARGDKYKDALRSSQEVSSKRKERLKAANLRIFELEKSLRLLESEGANKLREKENEANAQIERLQSAIAGLERELELAKQAGASPEEKPIALKSMGSRADGLKQTAGEADEALTPRARVVQRLKANLANALNDGSDEEAMQEEDVQNFVAALDLAQSNLPTPAKRFVKYAGSITARRQVLEMESKAMVAKIKQLESDLRAQQTLHDKVQALFQKHKQSVMQDLKKLIQSDAQGSGDPQAKLDGILKRLEAQMKQLGEPVVPKENPSPLTTILELALKVYPDQSMEILEKSLARHHQHQRS